MNIAHNLFKNLFATASVATCSFIFSCTASAQVTASDFAGSNFTGLMQVQSNTCASSPNGVFSGYWIGANAIALGAPMEFSVSGNNLTMTYTGTPLSDIPVTMSGAFNGTSASLTGSLNLLGTGTATLDFGQLTNTAGILRGTATYTIAMSGTNVPYDSAPCTVVEQGSFSKIVSSATEDYTLSGRIGGYNLICTILNSSGTSASGLEITAQSKSPGATNFKNIGKKTSNVSGIAKFNIKNLKAGAKLRCVYGSENSKTITKR